MKKILILLLTTVSVNVSAQLKSDTTQRKSQNVISSPSGNVPRLLVVPIVYDSTRIATRSSTLCDNPHGLFIIDDKEVPCDSVASLNAENIEDIQVLTLTDTHRLYGTRGDPYGALVLTTKKYAMLHKPNEKKSDATKKP